MQKMLEDLINGNLKDARHRAKSFGLLKICDFLRAQGWSAEKSLAAASYLKTGEGWQKYCDL